MYDSDNNYLKGRKKTNVRYLYNLKNKKHKTFSKSTLQKIQQKK
jgi:hypothetical protein